jgi:hypothetical protein
MGLPLIGTLVNKIFGLADKAIKDKDQLEAFKHELNMTVLNSSLAQLEVNKQEAAHKSVFVAGWRPFVGWVCGVGVAYTYVLQPLLTFAVKVFAPEFPVEELPKLELGDLMVLLTGMLGFGGLRTFEKTQGVSREK